MTSSTNIEWTDATWNPVTGCTKISAGCDHCYAERFSERFRGTPGHPFETGFDLTLRPERLEQPLRWRTPRMIFVNSMSDLFHKEIPQEFIARVFDKMEAASWHTFQVLTKRSSLMRDFLRPVQVAPSPGQVTIPRRRSYEPHWPRPCPCMRTNRDPHGRRAMVGAAPAGDFLDIACAIECRSAPFLSCYGSCLLAARRCIG
jgi:DNA repair photolyase